MKNILKVFAVVVMGLAGLSNPSNAQTVVFNGIGSSALFLQGGLAAASSTVGATCVWSKGGGTVVATDSSTNGGGKTETGSVFVAWTPGSGGCANPDSSVQVYSYLSTDSVVGDRCLFNGCTVANNGSGTAPAGLILGVSNEQTLPSTIAGLFNGLTITVAGTDIRPEDAEFAITRTTTACGTPVTAGSQYLGLGYNNGDKIMGYSGSTFNVIQFALPAAYAVTPVGATPIVVVINGGGNQGFSDPAITNLTSATLAGYLDGTLSRTQDALITTSSIASQPVTVILREPLSGTYNTMEYNVPNTQFLKTSQDVGLNQQTAQQNCNGTAPLSNPLNFATKSGGARIRAIGTGQALAKVISTPQSLGYGFWSVANFKNFTAAGAPSARYLTVDGVDPILTTYSTLGGIVPTSAAQIASVNLSNVVNGSYPIWSSLRLVNLGTAALPSVTSIASAAGTFVSGTATPDFVPNSALTVVHSHFIPPVGTGEPTTAQNGSGRGRGNCSLVEVGGDVGGAVYTKQSDQNFCVDFSTNTGETGRRR